MLGGLGTVTARSVVRLVVAALGAGTLAILSSPISGTPAEAQVYYSIYGGYRNTPPAPYRDDRPRSSGNPFSDFFGAIFGNRHGDEDDERKPDAFANHCVRTCDGKFFPVNRGGRKDLSLDKICHAMCPSAETKVFSGLGIDQSVANDGQRYTALPNAFAYRTKIVENCSCTGKDPYGVVNVDLDNDVTLQGGDIVVQESGFKVYRGPKDFVAIEKAGMSPAFVKQLQAIKILPNNPYARQAMTVTVRQTPSDMPEFLSNPASEIPNPNANAPAANQPPAQAN